MIENEESESAEHEASEGELSPQGKADLVAHWLSEIGKARKREKDFRRTGKEIVSLYEGEEAKKAPFNILYSNTETLSPALYNSIPRPVVKRRYADEDPVAFAASKACERLLEFLADTNNNDYETFDGFMKQAVLEALVPGRGTTMFKYHADIVQSKEPEDSVEQPQEHISYETVCAIPVPWNRFLHGYGKTWQEVPWIGVEHFMTRDELEKNFGEEVAKAVKLDASSQDEEYSEDGGDNKASGGDAGAVDLACVIEIWDKVEKQVIFIATSYPEAPIKTVSDPLGVSGFFPCPMPLTFVPKIDTLTPVALYTMYQEQAEELNTLTRRLKSIIRAIKVRGFYDSNIAAIDKLLQADDNTLMPAENVNALQNGQSLDKAIWLMPLRELIEVAQSLNAERAAVKNVIYEIMGIADILRGVSVASETATAQDIKNKWGALRIKRMQKEVMRYARDAFRIMAEIAANKFGEESWAAATGLPFLTSEKAEQIQLTVQQYQLSGQQLPPELLQALQSPKWSDVLALLQDNLSRNYRIDIETNSTVDAEATEDKQDIAEFLNAAAQFLNGVAPLVQNGTLPFEAAQAMLMAVVRRYRFGDEVEESLKKMQPPKPPEEPGAGQEQAKAQAELQAMQAQQEFDAREMQLRMELLQTEHALKMEELQMRQQVILTKLKADLAKAAQQETLNAGL